MSAVPVLGSAGNPGECFNKLCCSKIKINCTLTSITYIYVYTINGLTNFEVNFFMNNYIKL